MNTKIPSEGIKVNNSVKRKGTKPMGISETTHALCPLASHMAELVPFDSQWRNLDRWSHKHGTREEIHFLDELPHQVLEHALMFGTIIDLVKCYETYLKWIFKRRFDYEDKVDRNECAEYAKRKLILCNSFEIKHDLPN